ncbi:MAG TPA: rhomboid family intramembrane serine protease [Streptosporangiaceae bacterium]|nr:rhomboid family intramembrane serine protease [Streptosporangiaceae bacterium]
MSTTEPAPDQQAEVPTCYRHPSRESYVRCTRCDRYICPDCMRSAAVGHQCVECVREGGRTVRRPRTVFGGRVSSTPVVTYTLIAINVVVFLLQSADRGLERRYALAASAVALDGQYERMLTSAFMHYGIAHLLLNMWALYIVGQPLEQWLGRVRFTALYGLSALGGSVMVYLFAAPNSLTAGASGAIFGLFGAIFVVSKRLNYDVRGIAMLIVLNLVITFTFHGISWQGHIGGLITGSALAFAYAYAPRQSRTLVHVGASLAVAVAVVALVMFRTAELTL